MMPTPDPQRSTSGPAGWLDRLVAPLVVVRMTAWAAMLVAVLPATGPVWAEPIAQEAHAIVEAPPHHHRLWQPEAHEDAGRAAEQAATDALLHGQAARDRRSVLQQTYLGRPPTWIQHASTVNLAEFPTLADPTEDAEREMEILQSLVNERGRARATPGRAGSDAPPEATDTADEPIPEWLRPLLPSEWLPVVRAHGDVIVAGGAALLLASWLVNGLMQRLQARARRRRRTHPHGRSRRRRGADAPAWQGAPAPAGEATPVGLVSRRSERRRRRHRRHHTERGTGAAADGSARKTAARS
jgi:hypothetical protein